MQQFPSQLLEKAVGEFSKLPGVGRKTALRFVLHLLRESKDDVDGFTEAISTMILNTAIFATIFPTLTHVPFAQIHIGTLQRCVL